MLRDTGLLVIVLDHIFVNFNIYPSVWCRFRLALLPEPACRRLLIPLETSTRRLLLLISCGYLHPSKSETLNPPQEQRKKVGVWGSRNFRASVVKGGALGEGFLFGIAAETRKPGFETARYWNKLYWVKVYQKLGVQIILRYWYKRAAFPLNRKLENEP